VSDLPLEIPFADVRKALESLGIPVEHVMSVMFDTDAVIVEHRRADPLGRPTFGTVTTRIPYKRDKDR
jgi:hypothetical protein